MICFFREMGKVLFLDEDRMHVPLIVGSLTDEGFIFADNCYLRNSKMGESWRIPQQLSALQAHTKLTHLEIDFSHYSAEGHVWDCRLLMYLFNTFVTCATIS